MERTQAINEIKSRWREVIDTLLSKAKKQVQGQDTYICPKCNKHGQNGDGITPVKGGNVLHCFNCGYSADI